ncbi:MAG: histidine ammonia-lyase [bacterium]
MKKTIFVNGNDLTIENVVSFSHGAVEVVCPEETRKRISSCRDYVESILNREDAVYGINTGFGILSDVRVGKKNLGELQQNLIRSHAIAVGEPFDRETVRIIMLLRANVLARGFSGISIETFDKLIEIINKDVCPHIPCQGSVGASGDLAPLAHLALVLTGEGYVCDNSGNIVKTEDYFKEHNITPVKLKAKEGLALINGTQVMTAVGVKALHRVENLLKLSDIALATTVDAVMGTDAPFDQLVNDVRKHYGHGDVSYNVRKLIQESEIRESHKHCAKVQDSYSLRCAPQVHGAARTACAHARDVLTIELNSSTDNPLIFPDEEKTISAGNFHGEPIGIVMDYLSMAVSELSSISERRIEQLVNPEFSSAPAFLVKNKGLNSGYMIAHVAAASLVSENKKNCFPATVDSIPTSAGKEDHVSMGTIAARSCSNIVQNSVKVILLELLTGMQAVDFRTPHKPGKGIKPVYELIRKDIEFMENDRFLYDDFIKIEKLEYNIVKTAEKAVGELR